MSDYISKSALIEHFENMDDECNLFRWRSAKKIKQGLKSIIVRQPTVDEKEIIRKTVERIVERLEEKTEFLKDCTKYGNKNAKQQEHSYSTMMMYEVADLVEDLIDVVKEEGGIE